MDAKQALFELEKLHVDVAEEKINNISDEDKLSWLRSQVIGGDAEINTPFGRRILTYADHTASGRSLHFIENHILRNVLPYYDDSFVGHEMAAVSGKASEYIKGRMGGGPDDALLFCGSGATASIKRLQEVMGIAVPSIMRERVAKSLREEERWVVFGGPFEHHSNLLSWRQSLAEVVEIGVDGEGKVDMEDLRAELVSSKYLNRPMLGSFSACSNVTGVQTNTRELARLLHQHSAFACFDFAASGPHIEIDMMSGEIEGYDAVFLSPHKFLGGPGTPGILLVNKALYQLNTSPPSTCGGGTVRYVNGFSDKDTLYCDSVEEREEAGTPPIIQKIRAALAFWVKDYIGCSLISSYEHTYTEAALKRLFPNPNLCILGSTSTKRLPILSFLVFPSTSSSSSSSEDEMAGHETKRSRAKPLHGRFVARLLNDLFGIQARGGCACSGPYGHRLLGVDEQLSIAIRSAINKGYEGVKPGWTRVSFSYYMSKEEFAYVLAAIELIVDYDHRFLPLYNFNWETGSWTLKSHALKNLLIREELALALSNLSGNRNCELREAKEYIRAGRAHTKVLTRPLKLVNQLSLYLDIAKHIANSLLEDPQPRKAPENIDLNLVLFRI